MQNDAVFTRASLMSDGTWQHASYCGRSNATSFSVNGSIITGRGGYF